MKHKSKFSLPKENTKSIIEKNLEDEEYKKYEAIINKFSQVVNNKDRTITQSESDYSNKRSPSIGKNNKSILKLTISRTKDDRNDKDFLSTFMNNDSLPILPKNLHLLSDNDTNLSISNTEKFKNLANLMLDDKESYLENCFIKNAEDRLILQLYTTLGREAKEIFLEEESNEKISKKRLLFHKLNDIKIPKFDFKKPNNNINININKNGKRKGDKEEFESDRDIESDEKKEEENNKNEIENENDGDCYFQQKEKGYFHMPELINIKEYKKLERQYENEKNEKEKNDKFWNPEIDSDILSYINHNIIRIEDIYNSKDNNKKVKQKKDKKDINIEEIDEDKIIAVDAKEILSSESESEEEEKTLPLKSNIAQNANEEEEISQKKSKIKFSEFCGVSPNQIEISFQIDQDKVKETHINNELKKKNKSVLNKINSYEEKFFPINGLYLSNELIYRVAEKNEKNRIDQNERFTILPTNKKNISLTENSISFLKSNRKDAKNKISNELPKKFFSSYHLDGNQLTQRNSMLKINENKNIFKKQK